LLPANRLPLFAFRDIGVRGVSKWMSEYETLGRPMWTLAATVFQTGATVELRLLQVGAALEALGYRLAGSPTKPLNFIEYLHTIAENTAADLSNVYGTQPQVDSWALAFNAAYKGVKHADNPLPTPDVAAQMAQSGSLLARVWLAHHLAAP
jgi:hypothetical protein